MSERPDPAHAANDVEETHVFRLPHTALSKVLNGIVGKIGSAFSWLWLVLMLVIVFQVTLRYVFNQGSIMLEELQWHIYGIGFIVGLSYCFVHDRHVRVDVLAERWSPRTRAWVELLGIVVFVLPLATVILIDAIPYAYTSWKLGEVSAAPDGLPARWIPKSFIAIGFLLLILAAIARLTRVTSLLFNRPRAVA